MAWRWATLLEGQRQCYRKSRQAQWLIRIHRHLYHRVSVDEVHDDSDHWFTNNEVNDIRYTVYTFTFAIMLSPVRMSVVCLSVTFVHPTQAIEILAIFLRHLIRRPSIDIHVKFYGDRPRGTPPSGELNTRGVTEYSDFGPIKRYISETV